MVVGGLTMLSSHLPGPCSPLCGLSPASLDFLPFSTLGSTIPVPTKSLLPFSKSFITPPTLEKMDVMLTVMVAEIFSNICQLLGVFPALSLQDSEESNEFDAII